MENIELFYKELKKAKTYFNITNDIDMIEFTNLLNKYISELKYEKDKLAFIDFIFYPIYLMAVLSITKLNIIIYNNKLIQESKLIVYYLGCIYAEILLKQSSKLYVDYISTTYFDIFISSEVFSDKDGTEKVVSINVIDSIIELLKGKNFNEKFILHKIQSDLNNTINANENPDDIDDYLYDEEIEIQKDRLAFDLALVLIANIFVVILATKISIITMPFYVIIVFLIVIVSLPAFYLRLRIALLKQYNEKIKQ